MESEKGSVVASLFGETAWASSLAAFNRSPSKFLVANNLDAKDFVGGISQVLLTSDLKQQRRVLLLNLLSDHADYLLADPERLELTVNTLQSVYSQSTASSAGFFRCQVLVTMTGIMIVNEFHKTRDAQFCRFIDTLLGLIQGSNSSNNIPERMAACDCLREFETNVPCILGTKLGHFLALTQAETTYAVQNYAALFAETLRNVAYKFGLDTDPNVPTERPSSPTMQVLSLGNLLSTQVPLKPFVMGQDWSDTIREMELTVKPTHELSEQAVEEFKKGVSALVELQGRLSPPGLSRILMRVMECVSLAGINPQVFRQVFTRHLTSSHLILLQLDLLLKETYDNALTESTEGARMIRWLIMLCYWSLTLSRLMHTISHPGLFERHKHLAIHWLSTSGSTANIKLNSLYPKTFESQSLQLSKIGALSRYLSVSSDMEGLASILLNTLDCFNDYSAYSSDSEVVHYLFSAMFICFSNGNAEVQEELTEIVKNLGLQYPKYSRNIVDLVSSLQQHHPTSEMPLNVTQSLVSAIVVKTVPAIVATLDDDLLVLEYAASFQDIDPVPALSKLQALLRTSDLCSVGDWDRGNSILHVCKAIMTNHPVSRILQLLGEVLSIVWHNYKDIDVQDQARFYYLLLTSTTGTSLANILEPNTTQQPVLSSSVADSILPDSSFPKAEPPKHIPEVFLELSRRAPPSAKHSRRASGIEGNGTRATSALVEKYYSFVDAQSSELGLVTLPMSISFLADSETTQDTLIALVLSFETTADFHPTPDVVIPFLSRSGEHCVVDFQLQIRPREPIATSLQVTAEFSTAGGGSFSTVLDPVELSFYDFFTPAVLPQSIALSSNKLFDQLSDWIKDHLQDNDRIEDIGAQSVFRFRHQAGMAAFLAKLKQHVVSEEDGETHLLVFVPPSNHLLLSTSGTVAQLLTDNWKLVPFVFNFMQLLDTES